MKIEKYKNPDPRCTYPFEPCGAEYCWGYAVSVDKGEPRQEESCRGCEFWEDVYTTGLVRCSGHTDKCFSDCKEKYPHERVYSRCNHLGHECNFENDKKVNCKCVERKVYRTHIIGNVYRYHFTTELIK